MPNDRAKEKAKSDPDFLRGLEKDIEAYLKSDKPQSDSANCIALAEKLNAYQNNKSSSTSNQNDRVDRFIRKMNGDEASRTHKEHYKEINTAVVNANTSGDKLVRSPAHRKKKEPAMEMEQMETLRQNNSSTAEPGPPPSEGPIVVGQAAGHSAPAPSQQYHRPVPPPENVPPLDLPNAAEESIYGKLKLRTPRPDDSRPPTPREDNAIYADLELKAADAPDAATPRPAEAASSSSRQYETTSQVTAEAANARERARRDREHAQQAQYTTASDAISGLARNHHSASSSLTSSSSSSSLSSSGSNQSDQSIANPGNDSDSESTNSSRPRGRQP